MEATIGAQLKIREEVGFHRRQKHDLAALLREMNKKSPEVLEILEQLLASQSEEMRYKAVKLFMEHQRNIANDINTDNLQRLLANHKYKGPGKFEDDPEDEDTPLVDFSNIQDV